MAVDESKLTESELEARELQLQTRLAGIKSGAMTAAEYENCMLGHYGKEPQDAAVKNLGMHPQFLGAGTNCLERLLWAIATSPNRIANAETDEDKEAAKAYEKGCRLLADRIQKGVNKLAA